MKGSFLGSVVRGSRGGVACFLFAFCCAGVGRAQFTPFEATIARFDAVGDFAVGKALADDDQRVLEGGQ